MKVFDQSERSNCVLQLKTQTPFTVFDYRSPGVKFTIMIASGVYMTMNVSDHYYDLGVTVIILKTCLMYTKAKSSNKLNRMVFIFSTMVLYCRYEH